MRPVLLKLRGLKIPLLIFSILYIVVTVILPTVTIFMVGTLKTYGLEFTPENMTLGNLKYILFEWKMTKDAIWNSFYLSLAAAFVTMLVGTLISYVIVKMKVRGKFLLEFLGVLPFSVPGTVIALGVILMWSGKFRRQPLQHGLDHLGRLHRPLHGLLAEVQLRGPGAGPRLA